MSDEVYEMKIVRLAFGSRRSVILYAYIYVSIMRPSLRWVRWSGCPAQRDTGKVLVLTLYSSGF